MGTIDIDTAYSISSPSRLLSIISPFINESMLKSVLQDKELEPDRNEIEELTESLGDLLEISTKPSLDKSALFEILEGAVSPRTKALMIPYHTYNKTIIENLSDSLEGRLPYLISGDSITHLGTSQREGKNPLSPLFLTTTSIIGLMGELDESYQEKIAFMFPQPIIQTLVTKKDNRGIFLEDILSLELDSFLEQLPGDDKKTIEDLRKREDDKRTISLWHYNPAIFNPKLIEKLLLQRPSGITPQVLEIEKRKTLFAKRMLGYATAKMIDSSFENIMRLLEEHNLGGIPIFSEKTSYTSEVMTKHATRFSEYQLVFNHVGENLFTGKNIPLSGVNEHAALNYLSGHIQRTFGTNIQPRKKSISNEKELELGVEEEYPHLLIERSAIGRRPNIISVYEAMNEEERTFVEEYCSHNMIGVQRIEQRIVQLKNAKDLIVYTGRRNKSKENRYFHNETEGKKWLLALELPGFIETIIGLREKYSESQPSQIRGSELGISPLECAVAKLIGRMDRSISNDAIDKAISANELLKEEPSLNRTSDGTPTAAKRGTLLHHLWNSPIGENSAHLQILDENGITPLDTTAYAELDIFYMMPEEISKEPLLYTCHPDGLLFLQDEMNGKISILSIDRKTNPKTSYPEISYLTQVAGYNWIIEQILQREMGIEVESNYVVLGKNPGERNRGEMAQTRFNSQTYRHHQFSPITLFDSEDPFYQTIPNEIVRAARLKQEIYDNPEELLRQKEGNELERICDDCYLSTRLVCDWLKQKTVQNPMETRSIIIPQR